MARPQKAGLDYYPLDVDIDQDDKVALIEAKYGIVGFGVIIKLFNKIYSTNGYYCKWSEDIQLLFSKRTDVEFNQISEIIKDAIKWDIFSEKIWKKYKVFTSKRIQKTYLRAIYKRKEVEIIREYIVNGVNDIKNLDNVVINSIKDSKSTQSKVKNSKEENSNIYADIISYLNKEADRSYKPNIPKTITLIKARLDEKFTLEDFKTVINKKSTKWKNTEWDRFLRPETLFGTKFESYLNEKINEKEDWRLK